MFQFYLDASALAKRFFLELGSQVIDDLFAFIGMQKPCRGISWQRASNPSVRTNLEDLVRTRNRIAHGVTGVNIRKVEVTRYRRYVEGFAARFDRAVRSHVRGLTGHYPWPI